LKNSLYDSYIRAIKWASLRIADRGVVAFVTNGGWLDSNTADGMRLCLANEFSDIHILNLRGNQRTAGEQSRKEGGKVFGGGSRATVAVTILVKDPNRSGAARIHYTDIGDYLIREDKLAKIETAERLSALEPVTLITPNADGDWLNQRRDDFGTFLPIGDKEDTSIFALYSGGLKTNRDAWVYGSSRAAVGESMARLIRNYEIERDAIRRDARHVLNRDSRDLAWDVSAEQAVARDQRREFSQDAIRTSIYRPFHRQRSYFHTEWNPRQGRLKDLFPTRDHSNVGFYALNPGAEKPFAALAVDQVPDLALYGSNAGQLFARWRYEKVEADEGMLAFDSADCGHLVDGYRRIDNITDHALATFRAAYGERITKDDVFFYTYGLLHSPEYRETYAADLKKMLPRVPLVTDSWPYVEAGRRLSELHLGYETVDPYPLVGLDDSTPTGDAAYDHFRVDKMSFAKVRDPETKKLVADRSTVIYNSRITLSGIPEDAYRYMLGSRSAVEWIIDRYQVKTDNASGIVNDPNDWSREVGDPRYIIDLLARIVTVSLETMAVVDALPPLEIRPGPVSR